MFEADGELLGQTSEIEVELIPDAFSFAAKTTKISKHAGDPAKVCCLH